MKPIDKSKCVGTDLLVLLPPKDHNYNVFKPNAIHRLLKMLTDEHDSNIYRINISKTVSGGNSIHVICIGMEKVDAYLEGVYDDLNELPQWMKERIAVLSMLTTEPPTEDVKGIGRRINETTYWVYRPDS